MPGLQCPGCPMPRYKLLILDDAGLVKDFIAYACDTDEQARAYAMGLLNREAAVEVWWERQLVARVVKGG